MIDVLKREDREPLKSILKDTGNFTPQEIEVAMELIDIYLDNEEQKDYEIFVDRDDESWAVNGYVCIGPRPLTNGTYDLYWIAVSPRTQSKGLGSSLLSFVEDYLKGKNARLLLIETSGKSSYEKERNFYEKNSYDKLVEIKDFYNIGDSLVIYGKYL